MMSQGWSNWYWRLGLVSILAMAGAIASEQNAFAQGVNGSPSITQVQPSVDLLVNPCNSSNNSSDLSCLDPVAPQGTQPQGPGPGGVDPNQLKKPINPNILQQINPNSIKQPLLNLPADGTQFQQLQ